MIVVKDLRKTFRAKDTIALLVKDEGTLAAITNFFTLPLVLLSGVMLPVAFALFSLLGVIALSSFIKAMREAVA
jgi:hypothetical protein